MKFHPPSIVRFYYRYVLIFLLIVLPLWMTVDAVASNRYIGGAEQAMFFIGIILTLIGCAFIHVAFWEKFFGTLILTDNEIRWECAFRTKRVIKISDCVEIGAYLENEGKGIPVEQIYFSDHRYPQKELDHNNIMKASDHLIKFWYTEQLSEYLIRHYPSNITSNLNAYRRKKKK